MDGCLQSPKNIFGDAHFVVSSTKDKLRLKTAALKINLIEAFDGELPEIW